LINALMLKVKKAAKDTGIQNFAIAGGVSANSALRKELKTWGSKHKLSIFVPPFEYTTDNAAMIGIAGYYNYLAGENAPLSTGAQAKIKF
jgi:N6-L-threonylcarbamoyladenine synthase